MRRRFGSGDDEPRDAGRLTRSCCNSSGALRASRTRCCGTKWSVSASCEPQSHGGRAACRSGLGRGATRRCPTALAAPPRGSSSSRSCHSCSPCCMFEEACFYLPELAVARRSPRSGSPHLTLACWLCTRARTGQSPTRTIPLLTAAAAVQLASRTPSSTSCRTTRSAALHRGINFPNSGANGMSRAAKRSAGPDAAGPVDHLQGQHQHGAIVRVYCKDFVFAAESTAPKYY